MAPEPHHRAVEAGTLHNNCQVLKMRRRTQRTRRSKSWRCQSQSPRCLQCCHLSCRLESAIAHVGSACAHLYLTTKARRIPRRSCIFRSCIFMPCDLVLPFVTIQGLACGANLWFGGFPYPVNPCRPEWSKVQIRGKPLVATAQATCVSAGE